MIKFCVTFHDIAEVINKGDGRDEGMSNVTQFRSIPKPAAAAHKIPSAASGTTTAASRLRVPTTASVAGIKTKTSVTNSHVDHNSSQVEIVEMQQNTRRETVNGGTKEKIVVSI